jgi:hypothetical protein
MGEVTPKGDSVPIWAWLGLQRDTDLLSACRRLLRGGLRDIVAGHVVFGIGVGSWDSAVQ